MEKINEHFIGDEALYTRVLSIKEQVLKQNMWYLFSFMNPHEVDVIKRIIGKKDGLVVLVDGGFDDSEMTRVIITPDFYEIEKNDFQISIYEISYPSKFVKIGHRDVLGALMSLGLKRQSYGDIIFEDNHAYFAVDASMDLYIETHLQFISTGGIRLKKINKRLKRKQEYQIKTFSVPSFRLDAIISELFQISRSQAKKYIESGFVKVNYKEVEQSHFLCHNNDVISLRRYGRVLIHDLEKQNRKGKYLIEGCFYQ